MTGVVDMSRQRKQPAGVVLSFVFWILLEPLPLQLRDEFEYHAGDVRRGSDDKWDRWEFGIVEILTPLGGSGSEFVDEEEGVQGVEDKVEGADGDGAFDGHFLFCHGGEPEDLFETGACRHEEEDETIGG